MIETVSFVTITILAVMSPGADFAMVTRNSIVLSRRAGLLTAVGISLGVLVHVAYSMLGIGIVIAQSILLFNVIKILGAGYLIYLGATMLRAKKASATQEAEAPPPISALAALRVGFLTNALNPKTTLFFVSLFPQVISSHTSILEQLGYGAFISLTHLVWFAFVACVFSSSVARAAITAVRHLIERGIGGILVTLGVGLALSSAQHA
jgi:RhtB (resistance to homoserine/threonine) family protein